MNKRERCCRQLRPTNLFLFLFFFLRLFLRLLFLKTFSPAHSVISQKHLSQRNNVYLSAFVKNSINTDRRLDYRVAQKFGILFVRLITSSNIDLFSNFFHCQNLEKIPPYLKCVATLPLKATTENKTSVTSNFKKLTTGNNVFIVSVFV